MTGLRCPVKSGRYDDLRYRTMTHLLNLPSCQTQILEVGAIVFLPALLLHGAATPSTQCFLHFHMPSLIADEWASSCERSLDWRTGKIAGRCPAAVSIFSLRGNKSLKMALDPPIGSFRIETFIMDQPYVLGYCQAGIRLSVIMQDSCTAAASLWKNA